MKLSYHFNIIKNHTLTTHTHKKHLYYPFSCTLQIYASGRALLQRGVCSIERTRLQAWHSMLVRARVICSRLRLHSDRGLFLRQTRREPEASTNEMAGAPKRNLIVLNGPIENIADSEFVKRSCYIKES